MSEGVENREALHTENGNVTWGRNCMEFHQKTENRTTYHTTQQFHGLLWWFKW